MLLSLPEMTVKNLPACKEGILVSWIVEGRSAEVNKTNRSQDLPRIRSECDLRGRRKSWGSGSVPAGDGK